MRAEVEAELVDAVVKFGDVQVDGRLVVCHRLVAEVALDYAAADSMVQE